MVLLNDAVQEKKFDVRIIEKNVERGVLSSDELAKALKTLPDDSAHAQFVSVDSLEEDKKPHVNGQVHTEH